MLTYTGPSTKLTFAMGEGCLLDDIQQQLCYEGYIQSLALIDQLLGTTHAPDQITKKLYCNMAKSDVRERLQMGSHGCLGPASAGHL
jgi:hypothetical protein